MSWKREAVDHCFRQLSVTITNPVLSNCSLLWKMPALTNLPFCNKCLNICASKLRKRRGSFVAQNWEVLVHIHNRWGWILKPSCSHQRWDRKKEIRVLLFHPDVPVDSQRLQGQGPAILSRRTCRLPEDARPPSGLCLKGSTSIWWMNSGNQAVQTPRTFGEDSHLYYKDHIPMTWN